MGFERVTAIIQGTKNFTDFTRKISNYETDIFRPIFDEIEKLSGKTIRLHASEASGSTGESEQEKIDVAFRVIADHIRTLSFAIADGIQPGNTDRNYVLRRILRRAVRYGRTLGFHEPFFYKLVDVLARTMGDVFPELREKQKHRGSIRREEEAFNKTLDNGIELFEREALRIGMGSAGFQPARASILLAHQARYRNVASPLRTPHGIYHDIQHAERRSFAQARTIVLTPSHFDRSVRSFRRLCHADHVHVFCSHAQG